MMMGETDNCKDERGIAMLEAAIVIPLLFIIFAGLWDGFCAVQAYGALSDLMQEAARYAARVPDLEQGTYCTNCAANPPPPPSASTPGQLSIHSRIIAIQAAKSWYIPLGALQIITDFEPYVLPSPMPMPFDPTYEAQQGTVKIQVSGQFHGFFTAWIFSNTLISVSVAAPYLN